MDTAQTDTKAFTILEHLANAYATHQQCSGHHKAEMNWRKVLNYKEELDAMNVKYPSDRQLGEMGTFNGQGSY